MCLVSHYSVMPLSRIGGVMMRWDWVLSLIGDRHGRRRVMTFVAFGFLAQYVRRESHHTTHPQEPNSNTPPHRDLIFALTSTVAATHPTLAYYALLLGPILEGALGSAPAFGAVMNAYIADCTSASSRYVSFLLLALRSSLFPFRSPVSVFDRRLLKKVADHLWALGRTTLAASQAFSS